MRLHRLQVTAFGPFAGTVEVDLDAASAGGLFLIRGATGAGKTSLLDAVAFALVCRRARRPLEEAAAQRPCGAGGGPSVTLDFTAGGRRLRIERSPEFLAPRPGGGARRRCRPRRCCGSAGAPSGAP